MSTLVLFLAALALAMLFGGILHSRKLAETLGKNITTLNRGQGLAANVVSSTLVIVASLMGSPVSTTHVSTGAIFGVGIWQRQISWKVAGGIVLAWVATFPLDASIALVVARLWAA
jgi:PiT family inorganic phosphate transporter